MLERAEIGAVWASRYDRLHLHTVRWLSGLPGYAIPRRFGKWPARDRVAEYLSLYAAFHELDVRTGVEVERIDQDDDGWVVTTPNGPLSADRVVIATGLSNVPFTPDWPGADSVEIAHSAAVPQRGAVSRPARSRRRHRQLGRRDRGRPGRGRARARCCCRCGRRRASFGATRSVSRASSSGSRARICRRASPTGSRPGSGGSRSPISSRSGCRLRRVPTRRSSSGG